VFIHVYPWLNQFSIVFRKKFHNPELMMAPRQDARLSGGIAVIIGNATKLKTSSNDSNAIAKPALPRPAHLKFSDLHPTGRNLGLAQITVLKRRISFLVGPGREHAKTFILAFCLRRRKITPHQSEINELIS
jgi:hypothetical protein